MDWKQKHKSERKPYRLGLNELNDDNIDEIGEYAANIENEYVGVKGLTKEENELFKIAVKTVTELSLYDN